MFGMSITKRWLYSTIVVITLILICVAVMVSFVFKDYYHDYAKIPTIGDALLEINLNGQASSADNGNYYEVDLSRLGNITLNYGEKTDATDMYIINEKSQEVYYLKGIEYEGEIKHK